MFDPELRRFSDHFTVKDFLEFIKENNIPESTQILVLGDPYVYLHVESDKSIIVFDDNSLSDLPEYEGHEINWIVISNDIKEASIY